jgi:hypothetical protein
MAIKHLRSTTSMICAGNFCQVVWHWEVDDTATTSPYNLAKDLRNGLTSPTAGDSVMVALADCLAEDCYISSIRTQQLESPSAPAAVILFPTDEFPGTFGGNVDAGQVAGCVIWLTAADAGLNGRTFVPGVSEEAYGNGRPDVAYVNVIEALRDAIIAGVITDTQEYTFALRHKPIPSYSPIVHGYLSPDAGTQRRRLVPY